MKDEEIYNLEWMQKRTLGERARSARMIAAEIIGTFSPRSVLDLGCGACVQLNCLQEVNPNLRIVGVDVSPHTPKFADPGICIHTRNLGEPLDLGEAFDVVTCFEVAEHISRNKEKNLLETVRKHCSRWLLWSAAQPGQGGTNHVNLRPLNYWRKAFESRGFEFRMSITEGIREEWRELKLCSWYSNNLLVFEVAKCV